MGRSNFLLGSVKNAVKGPSNSLLERANAGRLEIGYNIAVVRNFFTVNSSSTSTLPNKFIYNQILVKGNEKNNSRIAPYTAVKTFKVN